MSARPTVLWYGGYPLGHHNTESEAKARAAAAAGHEVVYAPGVGLRDPRVETLGKAARVALERLHGRAAARTAAPDAALRFAPLLVAPPRRPRLMRELNARWLLRQLERAAGELRDAIVWTRYPSPELVRAIELRRPRAVVYECADAMDLTPGTTGAWREAFQRAERRLAALADAVVVPSEHLADRFRASGRRVQLLPHGVDLEAFPFAPPRARDGAHVEIGFVGTLDYRLDLGWLLHVAAARPAWRLRLAGPVGEGFDAGALEAHPNVTVEPPVPFAQVGATIASFDAGMMPYADTPVYEAMSPIKNVEIMAVGRPAVARPNPALERFSDLLYLAHGPETFVSQLERALAEDSPELARRRRWRAERESWSRRMDELIALLDGL
jgi:glycosyltransferase involved in cell wall biosynthesis